MNKKILWIALFRGIGDAVLFYPALKKSVELFPDHEVSVLLRKNAPAKILRLYGFKGRIYVLPKTTFRIMGMICRMGIKKHDIVFDASSAEQLHLSRWIALVLSKGKRVGYHYGSSSFLYNKKLDTDPLNHLHYKDIYWGMLKDFGAAGSAPYEPFPLLHSARWRKNPGVKRIIIHAGARDAALNFNRMWPMEKFISLIKELSARNDIQVILYGTGSERGSIVKYLPQINNLNIVDMIGRLSLKDLAALLQTADLFIGNNSGPMHIAAACGTPVVTFAGGVPLKHWGPPSGERTVVLGTDKLCPACIGWRCDKGNVPCLESITVEETHAAALRLLQKMTD